jgi:hypothetical protein
LILPLPDAAMQGRGSPANGPLLELGESAGGCPNGLLNRERFAERPVGTILCGSNATTEDFARWVLGNG